jgi:cyclic-di-GMP phosphodiesterase TipF (flagellum assembly factor)
MGQRLNAAIAVLYGLVALGVGFGLDRFSAIEAPLAWMIAAVLFLISTQVHMSVMQAQERNSVADELDRVRNTNKDLRGELDAALGEMAGLAERYEDASRRRAEEIKSEMRVLGTLIEELSTRVSVQDAAAAGEAEATTGPADVRAPAQSSGADLAVLLDDVRQAIEDNRVDLYLQPIVSLPQRRLRYYEGLTRLRTADGTVIEPDRYLSVAERAGLMSTIDNLLLFRCVQIVRRVAERHRGAGIFCNISGHSLEDAAFFSQFLEFMNNNRGLAELLVFEFSQATLDRATPVEIGNLRHLTELGFQLSLDNVTHLDFDVNMLRERSFRFVKVSAETLLGGMREAGAQVDAADLAELLARHGIELIAEKVEDERTVVNVLDLDIALGQGFLFGHPKPVRDMREGGTGELDRAAG